MADFSASALINQVIGTTQQSNAALTQGAADLSAIMQQAQERFTAAETGLATAITGAQQVAGAKAATDYIQESTKQKIQRMYGLDPESSNFYIADQLARADAAEKEQVGVRAEYDRLTQIDFISNPLGWIVAQTQIPQVAARNNSLVDQEEAALQRINARTTSLEQSKRTITANTADAVRANQLQAAAVEAQISSAKLAQSSGENIVRLAGTKMQQIQLADKVNDNTRSAISTIASIQNAEETRKMRAEAAGRDRKNDELRGLQIQAILDEKKAVAEQDAELDARLKVISENMGLQSPMTMRRVRVLLNKEEQAFWVNAASTGKYGRDTGEAVNFYHDRGNMQVVQNAGGASIVDLTRKLKEAGREEADAVSYQYGAAKLTNPSVKVPTAENLQKEGFDQYESRIVNAAMKPLTVEEQKRGVKREDLASPVWDKKFNPYVAPLLSFSAAISTQPELAGLKNNLVKQHIDALVKAGTLKGDNLTSQQQAQVIDAIESQVLDRKIDSKKAAADLAAYYKSAAAYNLQLTQYTSFALPAQTKYLYTQPDSGPQVDLFDPVAAENMLVRGAKQKELYRRGVTTATMVPFR